MSTYRAAQPDARQRLDEVLAKYHCELVEAGVTIQLLEAFAARDGNNEPRGPAIKHHGWPAAATVKINSQKDRVAGMADATINIDGDAWSTRSDAEQIAILDHECYHLEICRTKPKKRKKAGKVYFEGGGEIILDDCCRPKLKMRPHDNQMGTFDLIAERHGKHSLEAQQVQALGQKKWCQGILFIG